MTVQELADLTKCTDINNNTELITRHRNGDVVTSWLINVV